jgi:hypothetical protein
MTGADERFYRPEARRGIVVELSLDEARELKALTAAITEDLKVIRAVDRNDLENLQRRLAGIITSLEDAERKGRFILSGACVPADVAVLLTHQCDVPIRELAA